MKDMKQLINKWGESMLFSLLMALCPHMDFYSLFG